MPGFFIKPGTINTRYDCWFFHPSFFAIIGLTSFGFALPFVSFITCPMKKLISFLFPALYFSTSSGFDARILSTTASSSPSSETCSRPLSLIIWLGDFFVFNESEKISFAVLSFTFPSLIAVRISATNSGEISDLSASIPFSLRYDKKVPKSQFAVNFES